MGKIMFDYTGKLKNLFEDWAKEGAIEVEPLPLSGSDRRYVRFRGKTKTAIGSYHIDMPENETFVAFTRHFVSKNLPVPALYASELAEGCYLLQDLGNETLLERLERRKTESGGLPNDVIDLYRKSLAALCDMQALGGEGLDYNLCYTKRAFDKEAIFGDLNYFKYYFLKVCKIPFNEESLEKDFHVLADFLLLADTSYFLFRDFQARNIMLVNDAPHFIDYQGGMQGALYYDVASLLSQAKAELPWAVRDELAAYYMGVLREKGIAPADRAPQPDLYEGYTLIRLIQVLGSYGFRGLYEGRAHFMKSIPYGLENIRAFFERGRLPVKIDTLKDCLLRLTELERFRPYDKQKAAAAPLTVKVNSFSYIKSGIPADSSTNGGGFVFDCRPIFNPGRFEPYKKLTGKDKAVADFLKTRTKMDEFLRHVFAIVDNAVETYIERGFSDLMVNFGCTGGQHRSVYAAEQLARHLREQYGVRVELAHLEAPWGL
jgi:aminoglycoside/choline kinase family phosphotransferase